MFSARTRSGVSCPVGRIATRSGMPARPGCERPSVSNRVGTADLPRLRAAVEPSRLMSARSRLPSWHPSACHETAVLAQEPNRLVSSALLHCAAQIRSVPPGKKSCPCTCAVVFSVPSSQVSSLPVTATAQVIIGPGPGDDPASAGDRLGWDAHGSDLLETSLPRRRECDAGRRQRRR